MFELLFVETHRELAGFGIEAANQRHEFVGVASGHFDHRAQKCVHDFVERYGGVAGLGLVSVEQGEAPVVHRTHAPPDDGLDQRFLGLEMIIDGREVDARFSGDRAE